MAPLLLPPTCTVCGGPAPGLCHGCATSLPPAPFLLPPTGVDRCRSLAAHDGPARRLVAALKQDGHRDAVGLLGRALAALAVAPPDPEQPQVVTWAATGAARRRRRGFDQSALLAAATGVALGVPVARLVVRRAGPAQHGRDRAARLAGPDYAAVARAEVPRHVLVVDDVRTTGATLAAVAAALRAAGATRVDAVTVTVRP